jgi:hypothetical protein
MKPNADIKKTKRQQDDRLLKRLSILERRKQEQLRKLILNDRQYRLS